MKQFLAFDLGASSGRAILGTLSDGTLTLEEMHRFENGAVDVNGGLYWDVLGLFQELKEGLRKTLASGAKLSGMAVDTWGVDFAFLDRDGYFAGMPRHYRDPRTSDIFPYAFARVPREELYSRTGIQFMNLNSVFQLTAMVRDQDPVLEIADRLLFMPNALSYLLCGDASAEYTIATTSQAYDPRTGDWARDILTRLEIPTAPLPRITQPCTVVGELLPSICEELNCAPIPVILVGSHDTASAVAAVPARQGSRWAYLSSGTWSLLGVELDEPLMSQAALAANYTNEGGICGKIRFLKNIMGLWLIQESRKEWQRRGKSFTFDEMDEMALSASPFASLIDPNDDSFVAPGNMPGRIIDFCAATGQPEPAGEGGVMRCALESLALKYRQTVDEIEGITGSPIDILHLVGGGSKNVILNQFTANAVGRPVIAGPTEATALGNIIAQAMAVGEIKDIWEAREVIRNSVETREYRPQDSELWAKGYAAYCSKFQ